MYHTIYDYVKIDILVEFFDLNSYYFTALSIKHRMKMSRVSKTREGSLIFRKCDVHIFSFYRHFMQHFFEFVEIYRPHQYV